MWRLWLFVRCLDAIRKAIKIALIIIFPPSYSMSSQNASRVFHFNLTFTNRCHIKSTKRDFALWLHSRCFSTPIDFFWLSHVKFRLESNFCDFRSRNNFWFSTWQFCCHANQRISNCDWNDSPVEYFFLLLKKFFN